MKARVTGQLKKADTVITLEGCDTIDEAFSTLKKGYGRMTIKQIEIVDTSKWGIPYVKDVYYCP